MPNADNYQEVVERLASQALDVYNAAGAALEQLGDPADQSDDERRQRAALQDLLAGATARLTEVEDLRAADAGRRGYVKAAEVVQIKTALIHATVDKLGDLVSQLAVPPSGGTAQNLLAQRIETLCRVLEALGDPAPEEAWRPRPE